MRIEKISAVTLKVASMRAMRTRVRGRARQVQTSISGSGRVADLVAHHRRNLFGRVCLYEAFPKTRLSLGCLR
jgi:hypothetical protein